MRIVQGLDQIREHPEMYLGRREPTAAVLASGLAECALISQAQRVEIVVLDPHWIAVGSDSDWITPNVTEPFKNRTIEDIVSAMMPLRGGGQNEMRFEAIVTAFSKNLTIKSHEHWVPVVGELPPDELRAKVGTVAFALVFQPVQT
jgi:hypothetical protein